ncbi:TetR family transcriptional regulator [Burkholderia sp. SJ98]|nr:TetR family transcriptional regulator [Burkholderia sp. SJ98]
MTALYDIYTKNRGLQQSELEQKEKMRQQRVKRDPKGTRKRILDAAINQFAMFGLAGSRVDGIAEAAEVNERMLYYYFGNKEGLYIAVLDAMYTEFSAREAMLDLQDVSPAIAIRKLALSMWAHLRDNPHWTSLINNENLHEGQYLKKSTQVREAISPLVRTIRVTIARGVAMGVFRAKVDALDFAVTMIGMGYFTVSNRSSLLALVGRDYSDKARHEKVSTMHVEMLLSYLQPHADCSSGADLTS